MESSGLGRNVAPKHLFSSLLTMESSSAPVASCRHSLTVPETSESLLAHEAKPRVFIGVSLYCMKGSGKGLAARRAFSFRAPFSGGFTPERYSPFTWAAIAAAAITRKNNAMVFP